MDLWLPPAVERLRQSGIFCREDWIRTCVGINSDGDLFAQFLKSNLFHSCFGSLPPDVLALHNVQLTGCHILQIEAAVDISKHHGNSHDDSETNYKDKARSYRCLKMLLTDGVLGIVALEYKYIPCIKEIASEGLTKILVHGSPMIFRGVLLLEEKHVRLLYEPNPEQTTKHDTDVQENLILNKQNVYNPTAVGSCNNAGNATFEHKEREIHNNISAQNDSSSTSTSVVSACFAKPLQQTHLNLKHEEILTETTGFTGAEEAFGFARANHIGKFKRDAGCIGNDTSGTFDFSEVHFNDSRKRVASESNVKPYATEYEPFESKFLESMDDFINRNDSNVPTSREKDFNVFLNDDHFTNHSSLPLRRTSENKMSKRNPMLHLPTIPLPKKVEFQADRSSMQTHEDFLGAGNTLQSPADTEGALQEFINREGTKHAFQSEFVLASTHASIRSFTVFGIIWSLVPLILKQRDGCSTDILTEEFLQTIQREKNYELSNTQLEFAVAEPGWEGKPFTSFNTWYACVTTGTSSFWAILTSPFLCHCLPCCKSWWKCQWWISYVHALVGYFWVEPRIIHPAHMYSLNGTEQKNILFLYFITAYSKSIPSSQLKEHTDWLMEELRKIHR